jgi:hypothetical protein
MRYFALAAALATLALLATRAETGSHATHFGSARWLNADAPADTALDWRPDVETNGAGTWLAAWDSFGLFGNDYDIVIARSLDGGHTWSTPTPLNSNAAVDAGNDLLVRIEWDGAGAWLAVWAAEGHAATGTDRDIYTARSVDAGLTWSAAVPLNTNATSDSGTDSNPQAGTDGAGHWVAVWNSTDSLGGSIGSDDDILVARSADGGMTWTAPAALNSDAATDALRDLWPEVTTDSSGTWVAAWETLNPLYPGEWPDNDILFSRSTDNGQTWSALTPLHAEMLSDTGQDHNPQILEDDGLWLAAWHAERMQGTLADRDILVSRSTDGGTTWSASAYVRNDWATDTVEENLPRIATDGLGNWVVVSDAWDSVANPSGVDFDIVMTLSNDNALTWEPVEHASTTGPVDSGQDIRADVATDGLGSWVTVWDAGETLGGQVGPDREVLYVNCLPFDLDDDGAPRCSDSDDDGDIASDLSEPPCGADGMDGVSRPERLDGAFAGADEDGDGVNDEPLPAGANAWDCDGDGFTGTVEANVYETASADQDPCGADGWPVDFVSGGIPNSTNRVNLRDITSFLAPVRRLGTSPNEGGFSVRWDLSPGAGLFGKVINIQDLTSLISVRPPMLGYALANNGPVCPWPP